MPKPPRVSGTVSIPSCSVEPITVPRASATGPCGYAPSGVVATGAGAVSPPRIADTS